MKQHITVEQLNELSKKGKGNLGHWFYQKQDLSHGEDPKNLLLSIGQMIEFLDGKEDFELSIVRQVKMNESKVNLDKWMVMNMFTGQVYLSKNSLVGNLWEACKEVLEK